MYLHAYILIYNTRRAPGAFGHRALSCASESLPLRCAPSALVPLPQKIARPALNCARLVSGTCPGRLSGAIWGDLGTIFEPFSVDFVVERAFRRKTLDPRKTLAGRSRIDVRTSPEGPKNVRKSFRERLANDCPKRTLPQIDSGPPGLAFWSLRGVPGASGGVPGRAGSVARALRAPPGASREHPRSPPNRPRSPRGPPGAILDVRCAIRAVKTMLFERPSAFRTVKTMLFARPGRREERFGTISRTISEGFPFAFCLTALAFF